MKPCKKLLWKGAEWFKDGLNETLWFRSMVTCMCEVKQETCPHKRTPKNIISEECWEVKFKKDKFTMR